MTDDNLVRPGVEQACQQAIIRQLQRKRQCGSCSMRASNIARTTAGNSNGSKDSKGSYQASCKHGQTNIHLDHVDAHRTKSSLTRTVSTSRQIKGAERSLLDVPVVDPWMGERVVKGREATSYIPLSNETPENETGVYFDSPLDLFLFIILI
jgi:hypothetical protein